jgi:hypothetical protein
MFLFPKMLSPEANLGELSRPWLEPFGKFKADSSNRVAPYFFAGSVQIEFNRFA